MQSKDRIVNPAPAAPPVTSAAAEQKDRRRAGRTAARAMRIFAAFFLGKALALAFLVTPLWDVPDEAGHYAIVEDLADGRGLPAPGRSVIPPEVLGDWMRTGAPGEPVYNWVAQHPPVYHLLAVPFLAAARAVTDNRRIIFRAPRVLCALAGAAALLVLFRVVREAGADPLFAFAVSAAVGSVPMYSHMASGTNHDILVALAASLAALYWVRFDSSGRFRDGMKMGAALSMMGGVKLSAIPVAAALLLLSWRSLATRGRARLLEWTALAALSLSLPLLWTLRHFLLFKSTRVHPISDKPFDPAGFLGYLRDYPVMDHTFKNFFGLIGWTGSGGGQVRWFQISGVFLAPYLILGLAGALAAAWWLWVRLSPRTRPASAGVAAVAFAFSLLWLFSGEDGATLPKRLLFALLVAVPLLAIPGAFVEPERASSVVAGSHLVFLLFAAAYLVNSWEAYEIYGQMRATNGRYFFAVLPFLALAFLLPIALLWRPRPARNAWVIAILGLLIVNEGAFFLLKVIPFYRSGPFPPGGLR